MGAATASAAGATARPAPMAGYDYVHQVVDDISRVAYAVIFPDERGTTCAAFLREAAAVFARLGVRIERVMTDNAKNYTDSRAFAAALDELGLATLTTRPFRPQTNGKSERFNRTLLEEWAYVREYARTRSASSPLLHGSTTTTTVDPTALGGMTPMEFLVNNVSVNYS